MNGYPHTRARTPPIHIHTHAHHTHRYPRYQALGVEHTQKGRAKGFVCNKCQSKLDEARHSRSGCAACEEVSNFLLDLTKQLTHIQRSNLDPATKDDVTKRVHDLCNNIKYYVGHQARVVNQERYWPDLLRRVKEERLYDRVAIKSVSYPEP